MILDFLSRYGAEFTLGEIIDQPVTDHTVKYNVDTVQPETCDAATCDASTVQSLNIYIACVIICIIFLSFKLN